MTPITVQWPDHPFGKNRKSVEEEPGVTAEDYAKQIGKSKTRACELLKEMVEYGQATRKVIQKGRVRTVRYILKEGL